MIDKTSNRLPSPLIPVVIGDGRATLYNGSSNGVPLVQEEVALHLATATKGVTGSRGVATVEYEKGDSVDISRTNKKDDDGGGGDTDDHRFKRFVSPVVSTLLTGQVIIIKKGCAWQQHGS